MGLAPWLFKLKTGRFGNTADGITIKLSVNKTAYDALKKRFDDSP
jgi:hypothetical protein